MTLTTAEIEAASKRAATFIEALSNDDIFDGYHAFDIVELAQPLAHAVLALLAERRQVAELVKRWRRQQAAYPADDYGAAYAAAAVRLCADELDAALGIPLRQAADDLAARVGGDDAKPA